jgi:hypothetical protein
MGWGGVSQAEDEIEINIDAIDPRTFHELDRFVKVRAATTRRPSRPPPA